MPCVRLAPIAAPAGPRLHVRARSGYVDIAEATGDPRLSSLQYVLETGLAAADAIRPLQERDGREVAEAEFAPAVPFPPRKAAGPYPPGPMRSSAGPTACCRPTLTWSSPR